MPAKDVAQPGVERRPANRRAVARTAALAALCGVLVTLPACGTRAAAETVQAVAAPADVAPTAGARTTQAPAGARTTQAPAGARTTQAPAAARTTQAPPSPGLSLDQLAGQRVIYAYTGLRPPASLLAVIRAGEAAGVIFFAPNISGVNQIRAVVAELQRASLSSPLHTRLLMLVDQEGGAVRRLPGLPVSSEKAIGASPNAAALARAAGSGAARTLESAGMNVNLAPVLDVFRHPGNFIDQFGRSYSSDPSVVARLGGAFIGAEQSTGVAATAKHFPGLGAATPSQNTDLGPVKLGTSLATLRHVDEAPFRAAIEAGVKLVMTSWAVYPALDPRLPAGLSSAIMNGELRQRLGFGGVTITDGINAGAVTPFGDLATRSVLAARAGADLILCAATDPNENTPQLGINVLHAIASAIAHHEITRASALQAAGRVLALRAHP